MRLLILGATGKTGGALVAQSLGRGHSVTTFGRSPFQSAASDKLRNISGNPLRVDEIAAALPGHDAVISVLGTRGLGATSLLEESSRATIAAMRQAGTRRLIIVSSALVGANKGLMPRFLASTVFRHHARDQRAMENLVTTSDLDWTVLRPVRMTDSARPGSVVTLGEEPRAAEGASAIRKDDVARVILDTVESRKYIREIVHLSGASR